MDEPAVRAQLAAADITVGPIHSNLPAPELIARSLARGEGIFAANGALVVTTGERTGRSPADRYIVDEPEAADVAWGGPNQPCTPEFFDRQVRRVSDYLRRREVYVFDGFIGAEPTYRTPIRVVARASWHGLFAHTLFVRPEPIDLEDFEPAFTVIDVRGAAGGRAAGGAGGRAATPAPATGRRRSSSASPSAGASSSSSARMYGGEMKKALFTAMNYLLPERNVLPMHCSATAGHEGRRRALLRPLRHRQDHAVRRPHSPPHRRRRARLERPRRVQLRGRLLRQGDPPLARRTSRRSSTPIRFGSILENVIIDPVTRAIDWDDDSITENTRATYPVTTSRARSRPGLGGTPRNVFFLACDAYGVLPPIRRLTPEMASYHFLSGFTAKVAGTEAGVVEPEPTFSACFGAPFMPRDPVVYADMLAERLRTSPTQCWLVNTGWSGGPYGVGKRMPHRR